MADYQRKTEKYGFNYFEGRPMKKELSDEYLTEMELLLEHAVHKAAEVC